MDDERMRAAIEYVRARGITSTHEIADFLGVPQGRVWQLLHSRRQAEPLPRMTTDCRGCGSAVLIEPIRPNEDDTVPWRVTVAPEHTVISVQSHHVQFRCKDGNSYAVLTPLAESEEDAYVIEFGDGRRLNRAKSIEDTSTRTLDWWEAQYRSKLADLAAGPERERPLPTPEDLKYFEDKIRELGGNPQYAKDLLWLDLQTQLVQEICPEVEKAAPAAGPTRRVRVATPWLGVAASWFGLGLLNLFLWNNIALAVVWITTAVAMIGVGTRRR